MEDAPPRGDRQHAPGVGSVGRWAGVSITTTAGGPCASTAVSCAGGDWGVGSHESVPTCTSEAHTNGVTPPITGGRPTSLPLADWSVYNPDTWGGGHTHGVNTRSERCRQGLQAGVCGVIVLICNSDMTADGGSAVTTPVAGTGDTQPHTHRDSHTATQPHNHTITQSYTQSHNRTHTLKGGGTGGGGHARGHTCAAGGLV